MADQLLLQNRDATAVRICGIFDGGAAMNRTLHLTGRGRLGGPNGDCGRKKRRGQPRLFAGSFPLRPAEEPRTRS